MGDKKKKKKDKVEETRVLSNTLGTAAVLRNHNGDKYEARLKVEAIRVEGEPGKERPVPFNPSDRGLSMVELLDMTTILLLSASSEVGITVE